MKKAIAMFLTVVLVVALSVSAFAAGSITIDQAKSAALSYAGVNPAEATFTKAHLDYEYGYAVYELEFYANGTEYEVDVDANTGNVVKFSTDCFGNYYDYYDDDYYCYGGDYYGMGGTYYYYDD